MTNNFNQQPTNQKRTNILFAVILLLISVLLVTFAGYKVYDYFLGDRRDNDGEYTLPEEDILDIDIKSTEGTISKSINDNIAALNETARKSLNTLDFNPNPVFADGKSEGNLMIVNDVNYYAQVYEIYRADTDDLIFSGTVDVGHKIDNIALSVDLPKGSYTCYLIVHLADAETGKRIGTTRTEPIMRIDILS